MWLCQNLITTLSIAVPVARRLSMISSPTKSTWLKSTTGFGTISNLFFKRCELREQLWTPGCSRKIDLIRAILVRISPLLTGRLDRLTS